MLDSNNIVEVVKGGEYPVILTKDVYKGEVRYDLRTYYRKMDNVPVELCEQRQVTEREGEFSPIGLMPTKKGVSMTVDTFLLLNEAMVKLADNLMPSSSGKGTKK